MDQSYSVGVGGSLATTQIPTIRSLGPGSLTTLATGSLVPMLLLVGWGWGLEASLACFCWVGSAFVAWAGGDWKHHGAFFCWAGGHSYRQQSRARTRLKPSTPVGTRNLPRTGRQTRSRAPYVTGAATHSHHGTRPTVLDTMTKTLKDTAKHMPQNTWHCQKHTE